MLGVYKHIRKRKLFDRVRTQSMLLDIQISLSDTHTLRLNSMPSYHTLLGYPHIIPTDLNMLSYPHSIPSYPHPHLQPRPPQPRPPLHAVLSAAFGVRPVSLLRLSLLRFLDSNFPGNLFGHEKSTP